MTRINLLLLIVLVASALGLVDSRYEARWSIIELDRARQEERELDIAWRHLQLELNHYAQHARIDTLARGQLGMVPVPAEALVHLRSVTGAP